MSDAAIDAIGATAQGRFGATAQGHFGAMAPGHYGASASGTYGAAGAGIVLAPATIATAWNVQGDPSSAVFTDQARTMFGAPLPLVPNTTTRGAASAILWLGPRSWLVLQELASRPVGRADDVTQPAEEVAAQPSAEFDAHRDALSAQGGALFDVTASRVAFTLRGPHAATVLAAQCPLDFDPRAFPPTHCAQSLVGHINALIFRHADAQMFSVMVARSMAADAWHGLCVASASTGYDVAPASPLSIV